MSRFQSWSSSGPHAHFTCGWVQLQFKGQLHAVHLLREQEACVRFVLWCQLEQNRTTQLRLCVRYIDGKTAYRNALIG